VIIKIAARIEYTPAILISMFFISIQSLPTKESWMAKELIKLVFINALVFMIEGTILFTQFHGQFLRFAEFEKKSTMKNNMYCIYISFPSLSALHYISVESGVHALDAELDATRKAQREKNEVVLTTWPFLTK
jgi:hypothetical protein